MTLDVLISTHGRDGLAKVEEMNLPATENVAYVIAWQTDDAAAIAHSPVSDRDDVRIYADNSSGLSRNRNKALRRAAADICLIADNDLAYSQSQLSSVMAVFRNNPDIDIATFRYDGNDGKTYPDHEFDLACPPKGYWVTSVEIAFRRKSVSNAGVQFNELFGLGAPMLGAAEEEVFILDCLRKGLKGRFFPITITRHNGSTTGTKAANSLPVMMAKGAYHALAHPSTAVFRLALEAYRRSRSGMSPFWPTFRAYRAGMRYIKSTRK